MTDDPRELRATGACLCGAVRYEVRGPVRDVVLCHCGRCRRTHGHVAAYGACRTEHLALVRDDALRWYDDDGGRRRGFCAACGASVFWRAEGRETTSIAAGTIDPPTGLRTIAQIFVADAGDYYDVCGPGDRHDGAQPPG